jgi:hypothetical protein
MSKALSCEGQNGGGNGDAFLSFERVLNKTFLAISQLLPKRSFSRRKDWGLTIV